MSIFYILGRRFRRIQSHELERMFDWLFLFSFSLRRFCNDSGYYNSNIHRRIFRLQFIYNFVECFFRVKSIQWCGSWLFDRRITHIMNNVNLFSVSIELLQFLGSKGTLLANEFSLSISFDLQTTNESRCVHFLCLNPEMD